MATPLSQPIKEVSSTTPVQMTSLRLSAQLAFRASERIVFPIFL